MPKRAARRRCASRGEKQQHAERGEKRGNGKVRDEPGNIRLQGIDSLGNGFNQRAAVSGSAGGLHGVYPAVEPASDLFLQGSGRPGGLPLGNEGQNSSEKSKKKQVEGQRLDGRHGHAIDHCPVTGGCQDSCLRYRHDDRQQRGADRQQQRLPHRALPR